MKRRTHYILLAITLLLTAVCGVLMLHVNVNADMTKYLPDDSQMTRGLEIVTTEFGSSAQMSGADVHVMFEGLSVNEVPGVTMLLDAYPDVRSVSYRLSADSTHTVFDLDVPKSVDQKALGKHISNRFGGNCVVETSQDGATPPVSVMIIAAVLIMLVLFLMAQSWFEPVVVLISTLIAVVLNMGTNALLPSVSITTNFIGSILQAVLSLDYCIVLLNRYRQEQDEHTDRNTAIIAANRALSKAAPSILSSALTTIVGLLMLCFMRLKIGADMGIVLAKGVACSLLCTFTVMPSLMLLFRRTINHTAKRVFVPPTDGLARFVCSHKLPITICAVLLFAASWYFSRQTTIFYSGEKESQIEEIFPSPNPFVLVYNTAEEDSIFALVDSLMSQPGVQSVISYPSLMSQPLTPTEMTNHVYSLVTTFGDIMPADAMRMPPEAMSALTPDMMQLLYYMQANPEDTMHLAFHDVARFLHTHCVSNPLFAGYIDDDMREQIESLQSMLDMPEEKTAPVAPVKTKNEKAKDKKEKGEKTKVADTTALPAIAEDTSETAAQSAKPMELAVSAVADDTVPLAQETEADKPVQDDRIAIVPFIESLSQTHPTPVTVEMHKLTDTMAIRLPMAPSEMAVYMGSTPIQTRLVYGYAPNSKKLTPLEYVHLLRDDLFQRKGLAGMISVEQRTQLTQRAELMDLADANASLLPSELSALIYAFGVDSLSENELLAIAHPVTEEPAKEEHTLDSAELNRAATQRGEVLLSADSIAAMLHMIASLQDSLAYRKSVEQKQEAIYQEQLAAIHKPQVTKPSREDQQAELFTELMFGGHTYTSEQMATQLARLMALSDMPKTKSSKSKNKKQTAITPAQMSLLYAYYGSVHSRCDTMRLGFGPLLVYLCDTLVYDPRLADVLPDSIQSQAANIRTQIQDGLGQLRQPQHSLLVVLSSLPAESPQTYAFVDTLTALADARLSQEHFYVGESVMYAEMRAGFDHEMSIVTLLTILSIFLIVAITFRSLIVPTILIVTVMTAVYVNVVVAGLFSGQMLYLAYLIAQAILMGATIDYGILFANYYREYRRTMTQLDAVCVAYKGSIRTILTSGLIMVLGPGVMALLIDDLMISNIVGCIAVGAFMAITLILTVVPAVLVALDRWVVYGKKNRFSNHASASCSNTK